MTQSKHTKRALLASILSVVLCAAMLIGSTFAWFTDSVTSGHNKIVAGNLDVELEYWDEETQQYVSAKDAVLFDETTQWEPGHAEIVYLKVSNKGNLALKYRLSTIDTFEYRYSYNRDGEPILLSDYLELGIVADKNAAKGTFAKREDALKAITESVDYDSFTQEKTLLPAKDGQESADYLAFLVYMPETVGNEANHVGDDAPWIRFSLAVTATQVESESDSFGNDYDKDLPYPLSDTGDAKKNGTLLYNALQSEKPAYLLGGDADRYYGWSIGFQTKLDLNGNTLTTTGQNALIHVNQGGNLTITGNGTADASKAKEKNGTAVTVDAGGKLTIESGTFIGRNNASCIFNDGGEIVIKGGLFSCDGIDADGRPYVLNQRDNSTGTITVYGGTFINCDPSHTGTEPAGQNDNFVADGYKVISETKDNGDIWYTVVPDPEAGTQVSNADELMKAAENGGKIRLTKDIALSADLRFADGTVLNMNGKTLTVNDGKGSLKTTEGTGTLTIEGNGVINGVLYADRKFNNGGTLIVNAGENFMVNSKSENGWAVYGGMGSKIVLNGGAYNISVKGTAGTIHTLGSSLTVSNAVINVGPDSVMNAYGIYSNASENALTDVTVNGKYSMAVNLKNETGKAVIQGGTFITDRTADGWAPNPTIRYAGTLAISDAAITRVGTGIEYSKTWSKPTAVEGLTMGGCTFTPIGTDNSYLDTDFSK
ncbi:hypothetical protein DPQ25_00715 [Hydrogeniiclostridium mannosilyticum]|uniref:SipW-cognate class signal peptide n=1 Tax=Hydrogeniiclostridium mannosilyticum TaxID=2764322 RepID=A0A328UJA3_9FIRM|nr:SipW-dependent-type signal peptide-containing protein [Hydrogeniiclostridium mannosilyticum]RAQ30064.1 hypothetical protein DPQ25_00715 [Hydrogeniiclostridium mannosilyticum]